MQRLPLLPFRNLHEQENNMQLHTLKRKNKNKKSAAVGRGGKRGKTSGKGTKGQNARSGRKKRPEMRDVIKRLPKLRGRGKNSNLSIETKPAVVNIGELEKHFSTGEVVSPKTLSAKGLINMNRGGYPVVKILGTGELTKKVSIISCSFSGSAREKILKAGGSIK